MNLEIDFRSGIPIYLQVVERIKEHIASGRLAPGDQLPTVRSMALELRVNFNTIARAYRILDETGIISTQQGRGTYVVEAPPPAKARKLRLSALETLGREFLSAAARLGFSPDEVRRAIEEAIDRWQTETRKGD